MTEEKCNANFVKFIESLEKYDCYSEDMINDIGEKIKKAPYTTSIEYGGAEEGSLVYVTLYSLCKNAFNINNSLTPILQVNPQMLMRVLLLLNISKAEMFVMADDWHIKRGMPYKFSDELKTKMKLGTRSLYLCNKYGIKLEEEEYEAFICNDNNDVNGVAFQTPLYTIVKAALDLTSVELRQKYLQTRINPIIEK